MPLGHLFVQPDGLGKLHVPLPCREFTAEIWPLLDENGAVAECPVCQGRWTLVWVANEELDAVGSQGARAPDGAFTVIMIQAGAIPGSGSS
jgi:hypothetical protein